MLVYHSRTRTLSTLTHVLQALTFPAAAGVVQSTADSTVNWEELTRHITATSALYKSPADWCSECGNTSADVCLQAAIDSATATAVAATAAAAAARNGDSGKGSSSSIALHAVLSLLAGLVCGAAVGLTATKLRARRRKDEQPWFAGATTYEPPQTA
jgi:Tfp pilus assembly major pilin PilA